MNNSIFSRFTPREPKFFPLFGELSSVIVSASDLPVACMNAGSHEQ